MYEKLLQNYGVVGLGSSAKGDVTSDFLIQVAMKRGKLGKRGIPNLNAAAMTVITDWRDGRIEGWEEASVLRVETDGDVVTIAESVEVAPVSTISSF
jgi:nuclear GTP-binding protein